jgi:hypothetical protein
MGSETCLNAYRHGLIQDEVLWRDNSTVPQIEIKKTLSCNSKYSDYVYIYNVYFYSNFNIILIKEWMIFYCL